LEDFGMTMSGKRARVSWSASRAAPVGAAPTEDDAIDGLEFDDPTIDELELPELDTEDAEALGHEQNYDDLIDRGWLERTADDAEPEDERDALNDIGLTIELDGPDLEEEGAQVLDLDVGSLLTPLPGDATELDLEPFGHERGDAGTGIGILREMLLPDSEEGGHDDREVGDDHRFPVFDDPSDIVPRPSVDDDDDVAHGDELS
jgi:hypothetical protein